MGEMLTSGRFWQPQSAVAVLGGSLRFTDAQIRAGFLVGRELATRGHAVVTGATSGIPYAAALGAHAAGGLVLGISPADSIEAHAASGKPLCQSDLLVCTGMGTEGRSPLILRSVRGAVFIGGEFGTLGEFAAGWTTGVPVLGILEGLGGAADSIRAHCAESPSSWGSRTVFGSNPVRLAEEVSRLVDGLPPLRSSCEAEVGILRTLADLMVSADVSR